MSKFEIAQHAFTSSIIEVLQRHFGEYAEDIFQASPILGYLNNKAGSIDGAPNIGVECMGNCGGRILREDGSVIGHHQSRSFGWLRSDLRSKLDEPSKYDVVDLIGQSVRAMRMSRCRGFPMR